MWVIQSSCTSLLLTSGFLSAGGFSGTKKLWRKATSISYSIRPSLRPLQTSVRLSALTVSLLNTYRSLEHLFSCSRFLLYLDTRGRYYAKTKTCTYLYNDVIFVRMLQTNLEVDEEILKTSTESNLFRYLQFWMLEHLFNTLLPSLPHILIHPNILCSLRRHTCSMESLIIQ